MPRSKTSPRKHKTELAPFAQEIPQPFVHKGTKANPSEFCPYAKLRPNVPYFCLTAEDPDFELFVKQWALNRRMQITMGSRGDTAKANAQLKSALDVAYNGKLWQEEEQRRLDNEKHPLDAEGYKTSGPHKRVSTNTAGDENTAKQTIAKTTTLSKKALSPRTALRNININQKRKPRATTTKIPSR